MFLFLSVTTIHVLCPLYVPIRIFQFVNCSGSDSSQARSPPNSLRCLYRSCGSPSSANRVHLHHLVSAIQEVKCSNEELPEVRLFVFNLVDKEIGKGLQLSVMRSDDFLPPLTHLSL
ncbi:hypothetical protein SAY86_029043 [Trapa natans]|uniref:Uncharacterized protein n=1 Tax=Trapa natans TaxID=22666 RepID=A0AAN7MDT5_TRANT|nr:hypothetical protein SAY86_029043 [Trapa natans]